MGRMRLTIERLRIGIVVVAVLLVVSLSLFFLVARYERRRLVHDLPEKLGIHIQSSAKGVTFEQSDKKGRVLFTIHAAKVVQYKGGGRAALHDVSITLYGKQGSRADRIYGSDFEYDPVAGTARADGDVELDLQAPEQANSKSGSPLSDEALAKSTIHVKTSGLLFDKNTGIASTDKPVEFRFPQAAGKAVGASYDSGKGLLVLGSAVELTTSINGDAVQLRASHAQFLRDAYQAFLLNVAVDFEQDRSSADEVILYFRQDSSVDHVDAKGNLHFISDDGREVSAQTGSLQMGDKSQPRTAHLGRGVLFHSQDDQHQMRGSAVEATIEFGDKGAVRHAQMQDTVTFVDQQLSLPDDPKGSATRQMRAHQLDVDFTAGADRRSSPEKILATGDAVVSLHTIRSKGPQQNSTLQADSLFANLDPGMTIDSLQGTGHSRMTDVAADGSTMTSSGDSLQVKFDQSAKKTPEPKKSRESKKSAAASRGALNAASAGMLLSPSGAAEIQSAFLQGNVTMTQTPSKKDTKALQQAKMVATAQRAVYTGSDQVLHLDGSPRISDGNLDITAQSFEIARTTGDAVARGDVKTTYQQGSSGSPVAFGGQGPAHIVADEASLVHATSDAIFRGQARLWQGTSSVSAPVIEISRMQQTLKAHGDDNTTKEAVNAAFMSPPSSGKPEGVVRLRSQQLIYSDAERKATFHGSVVAEDGVATIRSDEAEVILAPAQQAAGQKSGGIQAQVQQMIAVGHVFLEQAGRKGTGERLVYTSQTGLFILSGTAAIPPRLVDPERGTVTGDSLIFNSRDDSVSVNGGKSGAVTETRVPK